MFWFHGRLVAPSKKLRASRASLRKNSNAEPWNEFSPDLLLTSTVVPPRLPYCDR